VKLGFLTVPFGDRLERLARWAKENGLAERAEEIRSLLDGIGIEISRRGY
jgi:hypothetical protein